MTSMLKRIRDNNIDLLDIVTSDDFVNDTGENYFWRKHAGIITKHFQDGDWSWEEALQYWSSSDLRKARKLLLELEKDYG